MMDAGGNVIRFDQFSDAGAPAPGSIHDRVARGRRPTFQDDDAGDTCPCAQCQRAKATVVQFPGGAA